MRTFEYDEPNRLAKFNILKDGEAASINSDQYTRRNYAKMTGFSLIYGVIYLIFGAWVYNSLAPVSSTLVAIMVAPLAVIALHFFLAFLGYISMLLHKKRKAKDG